MIFDRDEHRTYHEALTRARALDGTMPNDERKKVCFTAIPSVPCFELWLLLHYEDIREYFERDEIYRRLRNHLPEYAKGAHGMFEITSPALAQASQRAATLQGRCSPFTGTEPYTNADMLVTLLRSVRVER